ncbi:MAG: hypothetical protein SWK90_03700 [Chloroflexota bacterium]|nr:hypothetical protein [Chloroflexota bacterium]
MNNIIIIPTHMESQAVLQALPNAVPEMGWNVPAWRAGDLLLVEPGIGPELTAALLPRIEPLEPRVMWLFGWCGGLVPELGVGDLVLADATIFADEPASRFPHPPAESLVAQVRSISEGLHLRLLVGPVLTSAHVLASSEQKRAGATTGAVAVEMEAGPLARWAAARSVRFVHLRVVLDPLTSPLPAIDLPADAHGNVSLLKMLLYVLAHPAELPALWKLMQQAGVTQKTIRDVITALTQSGGPLAPLPRT